MSSDEETPLTPSSDEDKPEPTLKLPKSEVNFAFGPKRWYWVRCGGRWRFVRSNRSDWSNLGINDALWVAFKHDTGFVIGGDDNDEDARIVHSWNDKYTVTADEVDAFIRSREAYINLYSWLSEQCKDDIEKVRDSSVSIGPKGSYFARCGTLWISHALPKDLQSAIEEEKGKSYPVTIALGIKNAWIVLWSDGTRSWNLRHAYPALAASGLLSSKENRVVFAALNPYEEDKYFIGREDGACSYKASLESKAESKILHEITDEYMRYRAKRDGTSFSHPFSLDGETKQIRITPDSYQETGKVASLISSWKERRNMPMHRDMAFVGAVAVGAGALSKVAGLSTIRAVGLAASSGVGATLVLLYRR